MQFLIKPFFYIFSLCVGTYLVLYIEKMKPSDLEPHNGVFLKDVLIEPHDKYPVQHPPGRLDDLEYSYARIAWQYFEKNYSGSVGLAAAVAGSNNVSVKDMADYMLGLMAAREIGVVEEDKFRIRMDKFITFLEAMKLNGDKLPFRYYDIRNGEPLKNSGWSALDIGRFYNFVNKVLYDYPDYNTALKKALSRWEIKNMILRGELYSLNNGTKIREGKLGYEEYCSKALANAGYDVSEAALYTDFLKFVDFGEVRIAVDTREEKSIETGSYVTTEPYIMDGLEHGWDVNSKELSYRLFLAQKQRYSETGRFMTCSEEYIDKGPGYIYNTVFSDHAKWRCVKENGSDAGEFRTISTKIAFAWRTLYTDPYSISLFREIDNLYDPEKGWFSGKYEATGLPNRTLTLSTNSMILESLDYKLNGPLVRFGRHY